MAVASCYVNVILCLSLVAWLATFQQCFGIAFGASRRVKLVQVTYLRLESRQGCTVLQAAAAQIPNRIPP